MPNDGEHPTRKEAMFDNAAPPGAIIPPQFGDIGFSLPPGTWLAEADTVARLDPDLWEWMALAHYQQGADVLWQSPIHAGESCAIVVVRRRSMQVAVTTRPGDRVTVVPAERWGDIKFRLGERSAWLDDLLDKAVEARL